MVLEGAMRERGVRGGEGGGKIIIPLVEGLAMKIFHHGKRAERDDMESIRI